MLQGTLAPTLSTIPHISSPTVGFLHVSYLFAPSLGPILLFCSSMGKLAYQSAVPLWTDLRPVPLKKVLLCLAVVGTCPAAAYSLLLGVQATSVAIFSFLRGPAPSPDA